MNAQFSVVTFCLLVGCLPALADDSAKWWNARWRLRTTVVRPTPYRDEGPRPVEVAVDFPLLLERAGVPGQFDRGSLRVVERSGEGPGGSVAFAYRTEFDAEEGRERGYLVWMARSETGRAGAYDIYFDTKNRGIDAPDDDADFLAPENLLTNPGFEEEANGLPLSWQVTPTDLVRLGRFAHTTGERSLKVVVDESTSEEVDREVTISQTIDVQQFAGQEVVFACDLLAERAAYGAPVCIELQQFRADGSPILECAVDPRWLTIELAAGQLVQFCERGRFSHEAASLKVRIRIRCSVRDADTGQRVLGPESFFTVWVDRVVLRPGERWPWPAASNAGFVEGALEGAPLNCGFEFTGQRRLAFNGASEGTLSAGTYNPNPKSAHWGLEAGALEFWCRPSWNADDGGQHVFFHAVAYGHRLQSRLRKLGAEADNQLEFTIADADGEAHTVRGPAPLQAGHWHHLAATWDFPKAHLQLFVDGKPVAAQGPGSAPWASSLVAVSENEKKGMGITEEDSRSLPMQAFIGGDRDCRENRSAEAVLDELRISHLARYAGDFVPQREEFEVDEHTRALFHFENERHGTHDSDDRFVRGHLACEVPPQAETASLEVFQDGKIERRVAVVKPHGTTAQFEANRAENRLTVTRPFRELPDPRFVEYRERLVERTVAGAHDDFVLEVGGDYDPLMRSVTFERAEGSPATTTLLPRWRANDNVVPFSVESIAATLGADAATDAEKAFQVFKYALQVTNYYDASYCETLPARHRQRVSYTLLKALNIYPFDQCGPLNHMLRKLFLAVGISSNDSLGTHHQFQEAFYQGSFRLLDLSPRLYWLDRDNATVVSRRRFEDDLYLKLRQGSGVHSAIPGRKDRARFGSAERPRRMDFPLRPGEQVSVCWHNEGRWFEVTGDRKPLPLAKVPPYFGNGAVVHEPTAEGEAAEFENLVVQLLDDGSLILRAREPGRPAALVYRARCPYIFSDATASGVYSAEEAGAITLSLSFDEGGTWTQVWRNPEATGDIAVGMLEQVTGRYAYWLKVAFAADQAATVTDLRLRSTFVASPLALPGRLSRGENRIAFVGGPVTAPVKTTCRWVERYRSDLGVSLNSVSYYMNGDEAHRNLFVVTPEGEMSISVTLRGGSLRGEVSLEGLPEQWVVDPERQTVELVDPAEPGAVGFALRPKSAAEGEVHGFDVVVREGERQRRVGAQVLVVDAPLVREAEDADEGTGELSTVDLPEASGGRVVTFTGSGELAFDLSGAREDTCALWLRARWDGGSNTRMTLKLDDGDVRNLRASAMIGFTDWTDPKQAHTKMFASFGEQFGHWAWYRIPDVELTAAHRRLTLGAEAGACFDALLLLPQNPVTDRTAMNLFQNWNYAPWDNPL